MSRGSSIVSQFQHVRKVLVEQQRNIAKTTDVVMEGRDITFRVLPEAQLKIYLDATLEVRAKRRHSELLTRGTDTSYEDVLRDIQERDNRDMHRDVDPLHVVEGAWVLDTSPLTIDEVVDTIEKRVKTLQQN